MYSTKSWLDYSQTYSNVQDASHQDNFFRYGHVGRFDVYNRNSYAYNPTTGRFTHKGWEDTLVTFDPSIHNPELAAINNQYFNLFDRDPYFHFLMAPTRVYLLYRMAMLF